MLKRCKKNMTNLKNVGAFIKKCCNVFVVRGSTGATEQSCLQGERKQTEARGGAENLSATVFNLKNLYLLNQNRLGELL